MNCICGRYFCFNFNRESFGRTAIEAMSRKCAVLGRNVGGLPEVIQKEANIFDCDADKFVNRILEYKKNTEELEKDKDWFMSVLQIIIRLKYIKKTRRCLPVLRWLIL